MNALRICIPVLAIASLLLSVRLYGAVDRIAAMEEEIAAVRRDAAHIQESLPELHGVATRLAGNFGGLIAEPKTATDFCTECLDYPHSPSGFKRSIMTIGLDIPVGMDVPKAMRIADSHVYPGLVPVVAKVALSGSLEQIGDYLEEVRWRCPSMVVSEIDVSMESESLFSGFACLTFPQIGDAQDFEEILAFVEDESIGVPKPIGPEEDDQSSISDDPENLLPEHGNSQ